ncbi:MAG: hypothetical protein MUF87_10180 [Anaerolineae bacterium]|jgi:hypothetical protein|nr:hypothetical protein [Anaerolineae bacterium]
MNPEQHARLLLDQGIEMRAFDPPQALAILEHGRGLAEAAQLPCLVLNFDRWRGIVLLFFRGMIADGIDVFVRALVEATKPQYERCQEKQHLQRLLGQAYLDYDPLGYESEIDALITLLDHLPADESMRDHWCLIQQMRTDLVLARRDFARAKEQAYLYLARCEDFKSPFRLADAHLTLTRIEARIGDMDAVLRHAQTASNYLAQFAVNAGLGMNLQALSWQTLACSALGDSKQASALEKQVNHQVSTMKMGPSLPYYDAMCAYYEINGRYDYSLILRDRSLKGVIKGGSPYYQSECHLKRIRLLKKMGRPYHEDQRQFEEVAKKLKRPEYAYARLEEVTADHHLLAVGARILRRWFGQGR